MEAPYFIFQKEEEAIHDRALKLRFPTGFLSLIFVTHGSLGIDDERQFEGPVIVFWPGEPPAAPLLKAGTTAISLGISDELILDAIGARPESVHLRMLLEEHFFAEIRDPWVLEQMNILLSWIEFELNGPERSSPMAQAAMLRLLLIACSRLHDPDKNLAAMESRGLLREFRHLVELHYRDHWKMADYTDRLGVQYDTLHNICTSKTGRSPAELVHERLTAEIKARLERTEQPLKKIAQELGFADASRFSHFFKRRTGYAPGTYRSLSVARNDQEFGDLQRGFADWP